MAKTTVYVPDDRHEQMRELTKKFPMLNWSAIANDSFQNTISLIQRMEELMNTIVTPTDLMRLAAEKRSLETKIEERGFADGLRWGSKTASWESLEAVAGIGIDDQACVDDVWDLAKTIARTADPLKDGETWREDDAETEFFWTDLLYADVDSLHAYDGRICGQLKELGIDYLHSFLKGVKAIHDKI